MTTPNAAAGNGGQGTRGFLSDFFGELARHFRRMKLARLSIRRERRLRLRETLALGERRLVAIVECDGREFLVAATGQTISLLAPLDSAPGGEREEEAARSRAARAGR